MTTLAQFDAQQFRMLRSRAGRRSNPFRCAITAACLSAISLLSHAQAFQVALLPFDQLDSRFNLDKSALPTSIASTPAFGLEYGCLSVSITFRGNGTVDGPAGLVAWGVNGAGKKTGQTVSTLAASFVRAVPTLHPLEGTPASSRYLTVFPVAIWNAKFQKRFSKDVVKAADELLREACKVHDLKRVMALQARLPVEIEVPKVQLDASGKIQPPSKPMPASDGNACAPQPLHLPAALYTVDQRVAESQGVVNFSFAIDQDGRVHTVEATAGSSPEFVEQTLNAVRRWRFAAHQCGDDPVLESHMNFTLQNEVDRK